MVEVVVIISLLKSIFRSGFGNKKLAMDQK